MITCRMLHTFKLLVVVSTFVVMTTGGRKKTVPPRCCSPPQFTADLVNTFTTYKYFSHGGTQPEVKFAYDFPNRRWALLRRDKEDKSRYLRTFHDHKKGIKVIDSHLGCQKTVNRGPMAELCVAPNNTFDITLTYGYGKQKLKVDQWSYDFVLDPIRSVRLVSRDSCYPIKDLTASVMRKTLDWTVGNGGCIPWDNPSKVANGTCYMSFSSHIFRKPITEVGSTILNVDYRNIVLGIEDTDLFDIPENCTVVKPKTWGSGLRFDYLWRSYLLRFNPHNPF